MPRTRAPRSSCHSCTAPGMLLHHQTQFWGVELSNLRTTISIWVNKILHTIFVKFSKFHKLGQ